MAPQISVVLDGVTFVAPAPGEGIDDAELMANTLTDSFYQSAVAQEVLLPGSKVIFPSHPDVRVDWSSPGWFGIYESAFKMCFTIPCHPLVRETLLLMKVAPFQLMPSAWRILHVISFLSTKYRIGITPEDIRNQYEARGNKRGRVCFRVRVGKALLVSDADCGDVDWCKRWMFVEKASLGDAGSWILETCIPKVTGWVADVENPESDARIAAFLGVPAVERSWSSSFAALSFDPALVVQPLGVAPPARTIRIRRATGRALTNVHALRQAGQPLSIQRGKISAPSRAQTSSHADIQIVDLDPTQPGSSIPATSVDSGPVHQSLLKRKRVDMNYAFPELSATEEAVKEGADLYKEFENSLGVEAKKYDGDLVKDVNANNLHNAMCSGLILGFKYRDTCLALRESESKLKEVQSENAALLSKLQKVESDLADAQSSVVRLVGLEVAMADLKQVHSGCLAEINKLTASLKEMEENEDNMAVYYTTLARIELFKESSDTASLDAEIAEFRRLFPDQLLPGIDPEDADVGEASGSAPTQVVSGRAVLGVVDVAEVSGSAPVQEVPGRADPEI